MKGIRVFDRINIFSPPTTVTSVQGLYIRCEGQLRNLEEETMNDYF